MELITIMSSPPLYPTYPENGNLRMYNMFPFRRYTEEAIGIDDMTAYIPEVAAMGYNAVWVQPLQATGTMKQPHPDPALMTKVSGSLYAMADDHAFNPLIFPGDLTQEQCAEKLKKWTASVRLHGMFPLFDLVLNHVGINDNDVPTPLQRKLEPHLLLTKANARWPDIKGINYYRTGGKQNGINTEPKDLDFDKIDAVFETLWTPFITRYINDYGFMGIRIDAITHVPLAVQQRAIDLVQKLVHAKYGTNAFIVGELMVSNPEPYLTALSAEGLTHCLNPYSFFWGNNIEGGYINNTSSPFIKYLQQLSSVVLSPPATNLTAFKAILIDSMLFDAQQKLQAKTIYIFDNKCVPYFAINDDSYDVCFGKAIMAPLETLGEGPVLLSLLKAYRRETSKIGQREIKNELFQTLVSSSSLQTLISTSVPKQRDRGGLISVVGNHDVGTLKAKVMLDIAYNKAIANATDDVKQIAYIEHTYKHYKNLIKGARDTAQLAISLQNIFNLTERDVTQLCLDINLRMREKIFIQSMMCSGGWYSLAGDEIGVCHKPEVFEQFALDNTRVGSSLIEQCTSSERKNDLREFIRGINQILATLPRPSYADNATMHYTLIDSEKPGIKSANFLFLIARYSAIKNKFYLIGHTDLFLPELILNTKLRKMLADVPDLFMDVGRYDLTLIDKLGRTKQLKIDLASPSLSIVKRLSFTPTPPSVMAATGLFKPFSKEVAETGSDCDVAEEPSRPPYYS